MLLLVQRRKQDHNLPVEVETWDDSGLDLVQFIVHPQEVVCPPKRILLQYFR